MTFTLDVLAVPVVFAVLLFWAWRSDRHTKRSGGFRKRDVYDEARAVQAPVLEKIYETKRFKFGGR